MDEKGVSPVIGVILMVAATIVIAAVVMAMLGGFGPPKRQYTVTASAVESGSDTDGDDAVPEIIITYTGGPDQDLVDYLDVMIDGTDVYTETAGTNQTPDFGESETTPTKDVSVGVSVTIDSDNTNMKGWAAFTPDVGPGNDHVIVTAHFLDGSTQVILDTYV